MKKKILIFAGAILVTFFFFYDTHSLFENLQLYAEGGNKEIFEIQVSSEEIMNEKKNQLIKDPSHAYHQSTLKFVPYVLLETKFVDAREQSKEGWVLWNAVDGEIVLDTESWQTTHGFRDALLSDASQEDFLLMHALLKRKNSSSKEQLQKDLKLEKEPFDKILQKASQKNLVVLLQETVKLHLEDPLLLTHPISSIKHPFVIHEVDFGSLVEKRFSLRKIQTIARACFGKNFTIRRAKEVFLPVWKIEVTKPDGSLSVSYWNGVNGLEIDQRKNWLPFD